jgi:hypothetical protein
MDEEFEYEEFMDVGCPSCGALPSEDCSEDCIPLEGIHPMMYQLAQEKMEYVAHKVGVDVMKRFKRKLLTEKVEHVIEDWTLFTNFGKSLVNSDVLKQPHDVVEFFQNPNIYRRHYVLWNELGQPINRDAETWSMFLDALRNTDGKQTKDTRN